MNNTRGRIEPGSVEMQCREAYEPLHHDSFIAISKFGDTNAIKSYQISISIKTSLRVPHSRPCVGSDLIWYFFDRSNT